MQSSGSISCSAAPSQNPVASGQAFNVTVTVTGAQGSISIDNTGYRNVSNQTQFNLTARFTRSGGSGTATVYPSVTVRDSQGDYATCMFSVTIH